MKILVQVLISLGVLSWSVAGVAKIPQKVNFSGLIRLHVEAFYAARIVPQVIPSEQCQAPTGPSCMEVACDKLGTFGCDGFDKVRAVGQSCRGNFNGLCLKAMCENLGTFGCDSFDKVQQVASACVGNVDASCVNFVCQKLGSFGCDSMDKVTQVAANCGGH